MPHVSIRLPARLDSRSGIGWFALWSAKNRDRIEERLLNVDGPGAQELPAEASGLTPKPGLTPRPAARSARRFQLARLAVAFGGLDRGISAVVSLIRVPLLIWGLELYQYGLYMAILGLVAAANLLDFGLHFGVVNNVASARGNDDEKSIRQTIATAFLIYSAIAATCVVLILPAVWLAPLHVLLGIGLDQVPQARHVVLLAMASLLLPLPLKVFAAGLDGFQKQYTVSIYRSFSSLFQLALLACGVVLFRGQLVAVVTATVVGELVHWIVLAFYAVKRQPELALHLGAASRSLAPVLFSTSLMFLVTNLANLFKFTLGSSIISHGMGPAAVPVFSVSMALFMTAYSIASLVSASFWPAFGEAAARGEWQWIQRAFDLSAKTAIGVSALFAVLGALFGDMVIAVWIPRQIEPSATLLALLAIWLLTQTAVHACNNLLAGLNRIHLVMQVTLIEGLSVFGLSLWLVGRLGVEGVATAMVASGLVAASLLLLYVAPKKAGKRLYVPWGALSRIGFCGLVAGAVGVMLRRVLIDLQPVVLLIVGAGLTAATFAGLAWWLAILPDERDRLRSWVRQQLLRRSPG